METIFLILHFPFLNILIQFFILLSSNKLLKSHEITNIIWIGNKNFRYVSFANYANGDMIVETTSNPPSSKRMFYGLKENGEYFFNKNGISTPFYSLDAESTNKLESEIFAIKVTDTNKEHLVSISTNDEYCELYDFEKNGISKVKSSEFLNISMTSLGKANTLVINEKNYAIYAFWSNNIFKIYKLYFKSSNINEVEISESYTEDFSNKTIGNHISCFKSQESDIFICLILYKESNYISKFYLIALDKDLKKLGDGSFTSTGFYPDSFYKCNTLKYNIGVILYYASNNNKIFPYISLYYYNDTSKAIREYLSPIEINYDNIQFNTYYSLNDVIKLSDTKVCFITTSQKKGILYVVLINITDNLTIFKYYHINFYSNNYKIYNDIKFNSFYNMVTMAFSFCQSSIWDDTQDNIYYSGLMIFSYPNTTDVYINLKKKRKM